MEAKARPKNALKKGLKPTKMSSLSLKRPIFEISSEEEDDKDDVDDETVSEPSLLPTKRSRMTNVHTGASPHCSALEEMQAAAGENESPTLNQFRTQPTSNEATLPSSSTFSHSNDVNFQRSPNASMSSRTFVAPNDEFSAGGTTNGSPVGDNVAFTTAQPGVTNSTTVTGTEPLNPAHETASSNIFAISAPTGPIILHENLNTANSSNTVKNSNTTNNSLPILNPYILNHTTLRIYLPTTRVYVPLKLRSCLTVHALFSAVTKILNHTDHRRFSLLEMRLDEARQGDKGVVAVHADLEDSWECFLEEVQGWEGWREDGVGDLGVSICACVVLDGQGV
ncbi:MAG: hypothetical protein Q9216_006317 [Gyalolechia sp. 2 TL-2023]